MNIVLKIIGFVIALGALGYRIFCNIYYYDSIKMEWGRTTYMFGVLYLLSLLAIANSFTKGWPAMIIAYAVVSLSILLLGVDGLFWVAKRFDPSNRTMTEMGYLPLVHFLNCIAGVFNIIGATVDLAKKGQKD